MFLFSQRKSEQHNESFYPLENTQTFDGSKVMRGPSLFTSSGRRKYLNAEERARFLNAIKNLPPQKKSFCLTLYWSGARLSEVLDLRSDQILRTEGVIVFRSLKKRGLLHHRYVPIPQEVLVELEALDGNLFPWGRTQAWAIVKSAMDEAGILGPQACPRGLRHSFAVHAVSVGVPLPFIQRWLGHARLDTTAIYTQALGPEERLIAQRMW